MATISENLQILKNSITSIKQAIINKCGNVEGNITTYADYINSINTNTGDNQSPTPVPVSDVKFYDYDGTLLYSCTKEQFLALSAMPGLPTRDGLICQGWNWTLNDAKEYVTDYGMLNIGTMYITDDGDTRLYIHIEDEYRTVVPLRWGQTVANGVSIDWGDGSDIQTFTGTGNKNTTHTYSEPGDYVIRLKVADDCTLGLGHTHDSFYCVMGDTTSVKNYVYRNMLRKVEIGDRVTNINKHAFMNCSALKSISMPIGVTSIGDNSFISCCSLKSISIPTGVIDIGENGSWGYAFSQCYSLASVSIPNSVTYIRQYTFNRCYSLSSITIPSSVTGFSRYAFDQCYSLTSVTIPNSVKSIGNNVFYDCSALSSITIPSSVTNISNYAFYKCASLSSVSIPSSVTSIGDYAFGYCYGMAIYDFTNHTSVPTLSNTNAFTSIPSDCVIKVPESLLEEWKAATNWSTYADKIVAG